MRFMVCATGKDDQLMFIPEVRELNAGVELQSYGLNGCHSSDAWQEKQTAHQTFRARFPGRLAVHGPFIGIDYAYTEHFLKDAVRKRMDLTFNTVKTLRADTVVLHTGFKLEVFQFDYSDFWVDETSRFWKQEIQRYAEAGITVVLENVTEPDPELMLRIHDRVDSPYLKLCLDIGHVNVWSELSSAHWIQQVGPRLHHVHLHDNQGESDQHLPVEKGNIDFARIFKNEFELRK